MQWLNQLVTQKKRKENPLNIHQEDKIEPGVKKMYVSFTLVKVQDSIHLILLYFVFFNAETDVHIKQVFKVNEKKRKNTISYCSEFSSSSRHSFLKHLICSIPVSVTSSFLVYILHTWYSHKSDCSREHNITTMQMELNCDLDPRAQESEGEKRRKSECLCLFSALCYSGAWELQRLGQALRNILSCNVNMSELWSSMALPSPFQFNPAFCARGLPVTSGAHFLISWAG